MPDLKEGDLRFWWIPQIPGKAFEVRVATIAEGRKLEEIFADYDLFQLEQHVKPDYSNMGGVARWESDGSGGFDWFDVEEEEEDAPMPEQVPPMADFKSRCVCCDAGTGTFLCPYCWDSCIRVGGDSVVHKHIP